MTELEIEGRLKLSFPDHWQVTKLDDEPWYREDLKSQVRAVDVVAKREDTHWWIEVKDCEGYEEANLPRLAPAEPPAVMEARRLIERENLQAEVRVRRAKPFIVDEIADKVTGSIICLVTAERAAKSTVDAARVREYVSAMTTGSSWTIALLLTWNPADFKRLAKLLTTKMSQRFAAYDVKCVVVDGGDTDYGQPWSVERIG